MKSILRLSIATAAVMSLANCGQNGFSSVQGLSNTTEVSQEVVAPTELQVQSNSSLPKNYSNIRGIPVQINYIVKLYKNVLRRTPSNEEVQVWATAYSTLKFGCIGITSMFVKSPESKVLINNLLSVDVVPHLYTATFGRPVDTGGYQFWTNFLNKGAMTREQIASSLLNSPEMGNTCLANGLLP